MALAKRRVPLTKRIPVPKQIEERQHQTEQQFQPNVRKEESISNSLS